MKAMKFLRNFFRSKAAVFSVSIPGLILAIAISLCVCVVMYSPAELLEMPDKGVLKKVFHVDVQRNEYTIELKNPAAVSSEAIIIGFGSSSCRSR